MIESSRYEEIIASIAGVAAFKVEGVASLSAQPGARHKSKKRAPKSVQVRFLTDERVEIDIYVNAFSGVSVPDIAYDIQKIVTEEVENATKYKVKSVNINVTGIVFNE